MANINNKLIKVAQRGQSLLCHFASNSMDRRGGQYNRRSDIRCYLCLFFWS